MEKFTTLTGIAAPLPMINVDTDMIIPKQYLKTIKRTGLGKGLFSEKRYKDDGSEDPNFVLNQPAYRKAKILVANGIGAVVGGAFALRYRPKLPLVACVLWPMLVCVQLVALALHAPTWVIVTAAFFAGLGIAVHLTLWFTIFQREVPEHARSRVSSYDALGSFVLTPLGFVAAGLIAAGIGTSNAAWLAAGAILFLNSIMLLIPSVWAVGRVGKPSTITA